MEARCPNRETCFERGNITFLILGDVCTRNCRFCGVSKGKPREVDTDEPSRIAKAIEELNSRHIVITSVTRDDLPDGGASHFVRVAEEVKRRNPDIILELLVPDFQGDTTSLETLFTAPFEIFGHNLETVPRLYSTVRPMADYQRSLRVLACAVKAGFCTKTGLMVGCGERPSEVEEVLRTVANEGVSIVTIGQYFQPDKTSLPVREFVTDELFSHYAEYGEEVGVRVFAGPLVRSSYIAGLTEEELTNLKEGGDLYGTSDHSQAF